MKKLLIPQDKANHFIYGFIIYYIVSIIFNNDIGLISVFIIAILKEVYDGVSKKGTPEFLDFVFTILPALLMYLK